MISRSELITLITSAAYVGDEIQAEFGRIPPAFLPMGSSYLIQHQLRQLRARHHKFVSLPTDFELSDPQLELLQTEGVRVIRVNPEKSLGISVFQSILEGCTSPCCQLEILHGDTLVTSPPLPQADTVSVSAVKEQYNWGLVSATNEGVITAVGDVQMGKNLSHTSKILSGYFFFADTWEFVKSLTSTDFKFVHAIHHYAQKKVLIASMNIETLDFGHLKTLFASRKQFAATRHFNSLSIDDYFVRKRSTDIRKIAAEANWLRSIPGDLKPFTVRLIEDEAGDKQGEYQTLYSSYPTVAELYLAKSPTMLWRRVLDSCQEFLRRARLHSKKEEISSFKWLVIDKLHERIRDYPSFLPSMHEQLRMNGNSVGTLHEIVNCLETIISKAPELPSCIMHGDFCFSNMLFDSRIDRIQLIDPRGLIKDEITIYGDVRYDIAKLGHSILGRYDQIMAEGLRSSGTRTGLILEIPTDPRRELLEDMFLDSSVSDIPFESDEVSAAIVSLFLSMIPLHPEDPSKQTTMFANALRLYLKLVIKEA